MSRSVLGAVRAACGSGGSERRRAARGGARMRGARDEPGSPEAAARRDRCGRRAAEECTEAGRLRRPAPRPAPRTRPAAPDPPRRRRSAPSPAAAAPPHHRRHRTFQFLSSCADLRYYSANNAIFLSRRSCCRERRSRYGLGGPPRVNNYMVRA